MSVDIIPTIFSTNKKDFDKRFEKLTPISKKIQIDIMDGYFVKKKSILPRFLPDLKKYKNDFEAHLMVKSPAKWLVTLKKKGFKKIIFHYESLKKDEKIDETIKIIKYMEMEPALAINPETPIKKIEPFLKKIKFVQLMGIKPGKEGQKLLPETYKRIKELKKIKKTIKIQIDGGVNEKTANKLKSSGADILSTGSYAANSKDPKKAIQLLKKA